MQRHLLPETGRRTSNKYENSGQSNEPWRLRIRTQGHTESLYRPDQVKKRLPGHAGGALSDGISPTMAPLRD